GRDRRVRDDLAAGKYVAACRRAVLKWARRAARYVLCIRKEVPALFTNRQTPPRVALEQSWRRTAVILRNLASASPEGAFYPAQGTEETGLNKSGLGIRSCRDRGSRR